MWKNWLIFTFGEGGDGEGEVLMRTNMASK